MNAVGLATLSHLLVSPTSELSEFENKLIDSIHWFAAGKAQVELENRLLSFVTSIEVFLNPRSQDRSITSAVSMGVAMVLASQYEERSKIFQFMKRMYGLRSTVSHGSRQPLLELDIVRLRNLTAEFTSSLIRRHKDFKTLEDLRSWLERQQLS
jgi:hypothetical protein